MGYFRKILTRRAIYGTGKQSAASLNYYFKLEAENEFIKTKQRIEHKIAIKLKAKSDELMLANPVSDWAPKVPMCLKFKGAPQSEEICHAYAFEFTTFLGFEVVPLASFLPELANKNARALLEHAAQLLIESVAGASKINTAGLIDLYQDYIFLRDYIREEQQKAK